MIWARLGVFSIALAMSISPALADFALPPNLSTTPYNSSQNNQASPHVNSLGTPYDKVNLRAAQTLPAYNPELYTFSYKTFLAAGNLEDAYAIAFAAVKQNPNDLTWRAQLAQVATWTQRPAIALIQWRYLAAHGQDNDQVLDQIIRLATPMNDEAALVFALKIKTSRHSENSQTWQALASAYERSNEPEQAIAALEIAHKKTPSSVFLNAIVSLYKNIGNPQKENKEINRIIDQYGVTTALALREAEINYNHGDVSAALHELLEAKDVAKPTDQAYWRTLSDLAWIAQDYPHVLQASQMLYQQGTASADDYARLINLLEVSQPRYTFQLAKEAWHRFHQPFFFLAALNLGVTLEDWGSLHKLYTSLTPEDKQKLESNPYFWTTIAQIQQQLGDLQQARIAYQKAMALQPNNISIKIGYVWLLINAKDDRELTRVIQKWAPLLDQSAELWDAFTVGALTLHNTPLALKLFAAAYPRKTKDFPWQLGYAATLSEAGYIQQADWLRSSAWHMIGPTLRQQITAITAEQWFPYAELAALKAPGDIANLAMIKLGEYPFEQKNLDFILGWSIESANYELSNFLLRYYQAQHLPVPPIMALNIALNNNELETMQTLITPSPTKSTVAILDEVGDVDARDAAVRLGEYGLAEQYAYDGMQKIQNAQVGQTFAYQTLADTLVQQANNVKLYSMYMAYGPVAGINTILSTRIHLSPNVYITPFFNYKPQWTVDGAVLANVPTFDEEAGLDLNLLDNRNNWELEATERRDMHTFATAHVEDSYQLTSKLNLQILGGYMQRSYLTSSMLVGGAQNMLQATMTDNFDSHNFIIAQEEGDEYVAQAGYNLGWGNIVNSEIDHRFTLDYPDIGIRAFGTLASFAHTGTPGSDLQALSPGGAPITNAFFIPGSFSQWGFGAYWGQLYRDNYTSLFRPYFSGDIFYNTISKIGYDMSGGIGMSVLGNDQLSTFISYSQGAGGVSQQTFSVGGSYKYLF